MRFEHFFVNSNRKIHEILVFMAKIRVKKEDFKNFQPVKFRSLPVRLTSSAGPAGLVLVCRTDSSSDSHIFLYNVRSVFSTSDNNFLFQGWFDAGEMRMCRYTHTATVLKDGKVLVAGGSDHNITELYDPVTRMWSITGYMNTLRISHTASLLNDGRVLVAGGFWLNQATNTTELYDSSTGIWTPSGNMNVVRDGHTATVLRNGKVLVVGGGLDDSLTNTCELYDPVTGNWAVTSSMKTYRSKHTASVLSNGKVLVVGGFDENDADTKTAEIYDPLTETWTTTAHMFVSRGAHTATVLLNEKVLVAGGAHSTPPLGDIVLHDSELYDPSSGNWTKTTPMHHSRNTHRTSLLPNGMVLVTGGGSGLDVSPINSTELYDPSKDTWIVLEDMFVKRLWHTASVLPNGNVIVTGGINTDDSITNTTELYNSSTAIWTSIANLNSIQGSR